MSPPTGQEAPLVLVNAFVWRARPLPRCQRSLKQSQRKSIRYAPLMFESAWPTKPQTTRAGTRGR